MSGKKLVFKSAGYSDEGKLSFWPGPTTCGEITDGVILEHDRDGGWVVAFSDLEAMYEAAKKERLGGDKSDG